MSAPGPLAELYAEVTRGLSTFQPKHIQSKSFEGIEPGIVPPAGDPNRDEYLAMQQLTRHALGVLIWLSNCYPQAGPPTNLLCENMASPSPDTLKCVRHIVMHLNAYPTPSRWGGHGVGLEQPDELVPPFSAGKKANYFHWFSDGSVGAVRNSITGGVGMLAGGPIICLSQRQHLASPCSHSTELAAAGTGLNFVIAVNGFLQETSVRLGKPTPFYLDSKSLIDVIRRDASVKRSVWAVRRTRCLHEGVQLDEIRPLHIRESDMVADPDTKCLVVRVWARHMHYKLNMPGDPPNAHATAAAASSGVDTSATGARLAIDAAEDDDLE
jgi:hypothetical protein